MTSAGGAGGRSSVSRYLAVLVLGNLVVLAVVGIAGMVGAVRAHDAVHYLTGHVEPAVRANAAALQTLTDAETYAWGYGISGDPVQRAEYADARARFRAQRSRLRDLADLDGQVGLLVEDFLLSADNWFEAYADPRVAGDAGISTFDEERFNRGRRLFAEVRTTNAAVGARLQQLSDEADRSAHTLVSRIVLLLGAVLVLGATLTVLMGRRIGRRVTEPLGALEDTAHRLALGEHGARAPVAGPREVVQVATAVNRMADENDRARLVEARVVDQLRALDAVRSDFVSNVSHELRTPLTSVLGYVELLEDEMGEHAEQSELEMVRAVKRNVVRLGELIDDLLALTRSEGQDAALVPLDLAALTRDLVTDLRVASSQQGVEIRLTVPAEPVPVLANAGQLSRVVTNLVSNAVKFSHGAAEVAVRVVVLGPDVVLAVEDHGIGIPAAEMEQLGSRFYRASNAVDLGISGTGLGLRIVQAIVQSHGGSLELRSTEGAGTTVWVRLPMHQPDDVLAPDASDGRSDRVAPVDVARGVGQGAG